MDVNNTINDFNVFVKIWHKVENIQTKQTEDVEISENQANSDFRYFVNKYDATCNCYLCRDIGDFKLRCYRKGEDSGK